MAIYLGSVKQNIQYGDASCTYNFFSNVVSELQGILLLSSDDYELLDTNGVQLTVEE